ncbi:Uroporphyrinogen decarboxylase, partial [Frankliniella fusca]
SLAVAFGPRRAAPSRPAAAGTLLRAANTFVGCVFQQIGKVSESLNPLASLIKLKGKTWCAAGEDQEDEEVEKSNSTKTLISVCVIFHRPPCARLCGHARAVAPRSNLLVAAPSLSRARAGSHGDVK